MSFISVPPRSGVARGLLVILHGWGANAQDVAALAAYLDLPDYYFAFPDAPFPHPYSAIGRAWYNFPESYTFRSRPDFSDLPELQESRHQLIAGLHTLTETTGVPLSRTILGGFSQGGAMTLDVGVRLPLAALMVLSGYQHAPLQPDATASPPPVLMVHGRQDAVVPLSAAQNAHETLLGLPTRVDYHELNMGHEIQPIVLQLMQSFIEETIVSSDSPEKPL